MKEPPRLVLPERLALASPEAFLGPVSAAPWFYLDLDDLAGVELWVLVALCALSRRQRPDDERCDVLHRSKSAAGRFAHALGFDSAKDGQTAPKAVDLSRTVPIHRVTFGQSAEKSARALAALAIPDDAEEDSRIALTYVLEELLRNVLQHSGDALGAVVGAQRMDAGKGGYARPMIQLAVADTGKGILESLRRMHAVHDPLAALEMSLRPHISGTFPEGQRGGPDNAGLGLFFTAEMAKLTAGRFLLATRGGALFLEGNDEDNSHRLSALSSGTGFPGTLAVFELPLEVRDGEALLDTIRQRANERMPRSVSRTSLIFEAPPDGVRVFRVGAGGETADAVKELAEEIRDHLSSSLPAAIDFTGIRVATQSFLHALLFHPLRIAWALGVKLYAFNADPAVRSGLAYLESYTFS